jgi:hypothetical protein
MLIASAANAATAPYRWLEGVRGYEQALELQKQTKLPILVWTTQKGCPYCAQVAAYLNKAQPRRAVQDAIRVVLDEYGKPDEVALCHKLHFAAGNFYVLAPGVEKPVGWLWPWKPNSRVMVENLESQLVTEIAKAKPQG